MTFRGTAYEAGVIRTSSYDVWPPGGALATASLRSAVVGDLELLAGGEGLADQADAVGEVVGVEDLVVLELDLALEDDAGAGAAVALAAGEGSVDALLLEELQQHLVALPVIEGELLAVELDLHGDRSGDRLLVVVLVVVGVSQRLSGGLHLLDVAERVATQRHELLLVAPVAGEAELPERVADGLHVRRWTADEGRVAGEVRRERQQLLLRRESLHRLEPVHDDQDRK